MHTKIAFASFKRSFTWWKDWMCLQGIPNGMQFLIPTETGNQQKLPQIVQQLCGFELNLAKSFSS